MNKFLYTYYWETFFNPVYDQNEFINEKKSDLVAAANLRRERKQVDFAS